MGQLDSWLFGSLLSVLIPPATWLAALAAAYCGWRAATEAGGQTDSDLTRHRYVLGTIGSGKTMGLVGMLCDSVARQHASVWVSTHGARQVMRYLPDGTPVAYFHPLRGKGVNLLRRYTHTPLERAVLASQCVTVFRRLFGEAMGQGMVELAHAGALALLEQPQEVTLLDLYRALRSGEVESANEIVEWTISNADKRTHMATMRRLGGTMASDMMLRCLSATGDNALDLGALIDPEPCVIVCDIDQGEIGRENADLLAHILTSQLELVLSARKGHERMVAVYLDECQTYVHLGLAQAVEEGRKRRCCWTFAHQSREQLPARLKSALELCGSQYFFALRPQDSVYAASIMNSKLWPKERFPSLPPRRYISRQLVRGRYRIVAGRTHTMRPLRDFQPPRHTEPTPVPETRSDGRVERLVAKGSGSRA